MAAEKSTEKRKTRAQYDYEALITHFPVPGGGGAHHAFFQAGALGYKAGVEEAQIIADVKANLKRGGRPVSDTEIAQGIGVGFRTALEEKTGLRKQEPKQLAKVPPGAFAKIAALHSGATVESIMAKSPVPLDFPEEEAGWRMLESLYAPEDKLFIGDHMDAGTPGGNIRPAGEWYTYLKNGGKSSPFIVPNPLTGEAAPKKDGSGVSYRCDACIKSFRHMVVEMDSKTLGEQLAFWSYIALPVRALVLSGGKSIHGWVDVDCSCAEEWQKEIENDLFPAYLVPLGADPSCKNECRLSRMPGHLRNDAKVQGVMQKLIWLSPEGKAVCE